MLTKENLLKEYSDFNVDMTHKQKKYFIMLFIVYSGIDYNDHDKLRIEIDKYIKNKLNNQNKNIMNLSHKDGLLFDKLKNSIKMTKHQKEFISYVFTNEELEKNVDDMTISDFENMLKHPKINIFSSVDGYVPNKNFFVTNYTDDYEIGYVFLSRKTKDSLIKYIKFYDLLVFDYDLKNGESKENLLSSIKNLLDKKYCYSIYETVNGYHVFFMSEPVIYNSHKMVHLSDKHKSDCWYTLYCKTYGYSIRTSKKHGRNEDGWETTNKFVCEFGFGNKSEKCVKMLSVLEQVMIDISTNESDINIVKKIIDENPICDMTNNGNNFYSRFLKFNNKYNSYEIFDEKRIKYDSLFKNYIIEKYGKNYNTIKILNEVFINNLIKPHKFLFSADDYFIALDMIRNMYCIYYKNMMVVDLDYNDDLKNMDDILRHSTNMQKETGDTYIIYSTKNGAHVFVTNKCYHHNSQESVDYLFKFGADINHILMNYNVGYCIRLNKKTKDDPMYQYVCTMGNDTNLGYLVDIHIKASKKFESILINDIKKF